MVDRSGVVAEEYIDAVKWILNPNAGPVYWEQTYSEYEKYISRELLDRKIAEYKKQGKVDTSLYNMTEPEYNLKKVCKYPEYDYEQGIYKSYNSYEKEMTLTYDEFMNTEYKDYRYLEYWVAQDRNYGYYANVVFGCIGSLYCGYEEYDPSKGDDYFLEKQGLKSEETPNIEKPSGGISEFDKEFYAKYGSYPDDSTIQNRIVVNENSPIYYVTVTAPDGYVNLRKGAGTDSEILLKINNDTVLPVYEEGTG